MEILDQNLSFVWSEAFRRCMERGVYELQPLTLSVTGFEDNLPPEHREIRNAVDISLSQHGKFSISTTANTIFPISLWNPELTIKELGARYENILPSLKKMTAQNRNGTYFERLISYGPHKSNQLEKLINIYRSGTHRRSALQLAIYDPRLDQTNQRRRGFPCLQQIAFMPNEQDGTLMVHGFYATQYVFDRAYGNLVGLSHLGHFVAHELGLKLAGVTATAAVATLGDVSKEKLRGLKIELDQLR